MNTNPFIVSRDKIQEHVFLAISSLYGAEEFDKLTPPGGWPESFGILAGLGEDVFQRNLVTAAALARIGDDEFNTLGMHTDKNPKGVGEVTVGGEVSVLTSREACNKIIHAKDAVVEWRVINEHPLYQDILEEKYGKYEQEYRHPFLLLKGVLRSGSDWDATLNLMLWAQAISFYAY